MNIFSSQASITIMPRATALQILVGNYNTETLESIYGEVQSIDCMVFAPQRNRSKIISILIAEGNQDSERNADVPMEQSTIAGRLQGGGPETGYAREEGPRTEPRAP